MMHTIWIMEHNHIAEKLAELNPNWDDERLYQEARKIVAAMMQHITYKEWLPLILGQDTMDCYDLNTKSRGYADSYDSSIDASMRNVFGAAAFRYCRNSIFRVCCEN